MGPLGGGPGPPPPREPRPSGQMDHCNLIPSSPDPSSGAVTGFLRLPKPVPTLSPPGPAHPRWAPRSGGSAHLGPFTQPPIAESVQTFPGSPQLPMRTGEAGDLRSLSGPRPLTAGAGECRRARPRPSQAASARRSLASAPRPAPGSAPPWGAGLRAPARSTSPGCSALLRREGGREGGDGRTLATCGGVRGDSAAAAPPPPRIARLAGFVLWFFL